MSETSAKAFHYPFELKDLDVEARTFTGLASTWERDLQDDVIHRGAFSKTLREWRKSGRIVPLLDSHDTWSIRSALGKLTKAQERDAGLWTEWQVVRGDDGDGALARIADGIIDGLSIGYRPVKWEIEEVDDAAWGELRHLKEIELREVSLVLWPANLAARVDPVKAVSGYDWTKDQRRALIAALWEPDIDPVLTPEQVERLNGSAKSQDEGTQDDKPQETPAGRQPWQDAVLRIRTRQLTNRR